MLYKVSRGANAHIWNTEISLFHPNESSKHLSKWAAAQKLKARMCECTAASQGC